MKEYLCIKDFYIEDSRFATKGDHVVLLPDNCTVVNTNGQQKVTQMPEIVGDKKHFIPTFEVAIKGDCEMVKDDPVNHPKHYTQGNIECIDAMISAFGKEKVMVFCQCNAFKYMWRSDTKNGVEDLKKAAWYMDKYIELQNGDNLQL